LWTALSPWLILTVFAVLVNLPSLPFYALTFQTLAMPVEIIPGAPEKVRLFWQAYFWILVSTLLALPILRPTRQQLSSAVQKWVKRAPRPMLASAIYFAMAYVINHSGKGLDWTLADSSRNMVAVLADASSSAFGRFTPGLSAPYLGLLAGFAQRVGASPLLAKLTRLHMITGADQIMPVGPDRGRSQRHRRRAGVRDLAATVAERRRWPSTASARSRREGVTL
jgi:lactate permease